MPRKTTVRRHPRRVKDKVTEVRRHPRKIPGTPQKMERFLPKRANKYTQEEQEVIDAVGMAVFKGIKEQNETPVVTFREEETGVYFIEYEDGEEYTMFEDDETARRYAIRYNEDLFDSDPATLEGADWIDQFIYITDTDRNIMAGEESDNLVDEVYSDEELLEKADLDDQYDELQEKFDEEEDSDEAGNIEAKMDDLIEEAREDVREQEYDRIRQELKDPVEYFVEQEGMYSKEDLLQASFISIDYREAAEYVVDNDGWENSVATYDGSSIELPEDYVMARIN